MTKAPKPNQPAPNVEPSIGDIETPLYAARNLTEVMIMALNGAQQAGFTHEGMCEALIGQVYALRKEIAEIEGVFDACTGSSVGSDDPAAGESVT